MGIKCDTKRKCGKCLALTVIVLAATWLFTVSPPHLPSSSIAFSFKTISSSNGLPASCAVTISNVSDHLIQIFGGLKSSWFLVAYLTNGVWSNYEVPSVNRGYDILYPHTEGTSFISVSAGVSALKVSIHYTSLTWRGRLAWSLLGSDLYQNYQRKLGSLLRHDDWRSKAGWLVNDSCDTLLDSITGFFSRQDRRVRSKTEWSQEYPLTSAGQTQN